MEECNSLELILGEKLAKKIKEIINVLEEEGCVCKTIKTTFIFYN